MRQVPSAEPTSLPSLTLIERVRARLHPNRPAVVDRLVLALVGSITLFLVGWALLVLVAPDLLDLWRLVAGGGVVLAATTTCGARAALVGRDRLAWGVIAFGIASFAAGSAIARIGGHADGAPPAAHIGWLGFYACLYGALVLMARSALRPFPWSHLLDGVATMLIGVAALVALVTAVGPGDYRPAEAALGVAYPALDLLLVSFVIWVSDAGETWQRPEWRWMLRALIILCAADLVLFATALAGSLSFQAVYTVIYPVALAALGFAAWTPAPAPADLRPRSIASLRVPLVVGAAALSLVGYGAVGLIDPLPLLLAAVGLILVCVRGAIAYRELAAMQLSRRFEHGFRDAGIGMAFVDARANWVRVNEALASVLGSTAEELEGRPIVANFDEPSGRLITVLQHQLRGGRPRVDPTALTVIRPDGATRQVLVAGDVVAEDQARQLFLQVQDTTAERRAERLSEVLVDLSRRALSEPDVDQFLGYLTGSVAEALNADIVAAVVVADGGARVFSPHDTLTVAQREGLAAADDPICEALDSGTPVHWHDLLSSTGPTVEALMDAGLESATIVPIAPAIGPPAAFCVGHRVARSAEPPDEARFLGSVANLVTVALERGRREERSRHHALHDPLTGLANRTLLGAHVEHAVRAAPRDASLVGALLLDLDRFKDVNDTSGHEAGDQLLLEVAERLLDVSRAEDLVARLGGDEFVVVVTRAVDLAELESIATRILDALAVPIEVDGAELVIGASIGIAVATDAATPAEVLLRDADVAMYRAKAAGGSCHSVFDADLRAELVARVDTERALRHAVDRGQLRLAFQPQIALTGEAPVSFEALVRWDRPGVGVVSPGDFVHVAEDTGLIVPVGTWVLRETLRWAADVTDALGATPSVSVNVSARQLTPALPDVVASALRDTGVPATALCLELTESMFIDQPSAAPVVDRLKRLGVRLSLDDFGTGWSSLASLRRHPVDELKLDRSMIEVLGKDVASSAVTRAAVDMARALGISVVAEGIEDAEQLAAVLDLGCHVAQGFLLSRPLSPEDAVDYFQNGSWRVTLAHARRLAAAA